MHAVPISATQPPQNGRAARGTFMVILAVLWALFGLGYAAWTVLAFARQCESFQLTSTQARYTVLWTGGTWSVALLSASLGVLRGKAWAAPAALWLCGWMVACLVAQVAGMLAGSGATASALVGVGVGLLLLALVTRWFLWLFGRAAVQPRWLAVAGLVWTGWAWASLVLPVLDPAANRPAPLALPGCTYLGWAGVALLWVAAFALSRNRRGAIQLGVAFVAASGIALGYAMGTDQQAVLEPITFAALGACGMVKVGDGLEILATQYAGAGAAAALCVQVIAALALLFWRRRASRPEASGEEATVAPIRSTEAGAVGTPRRFGIGTLLAVTTALAVLIGLLRALYVPDLLAVCISLFVAIVAASQALLLKGRVPRVGSMTIGALFVVVAAIVVTQMTEPKTVPALLDYIPWLFVSGGVLGYIGGTAVAGFFMVLRDLAERRKGRATSAPPAVTEPKPRRRWLRMPVSWTTLVLLLMIPAGLWLGLEVHPLRQQSRAAAALKRLGARLEAEDEVPLPWSREPYLFNVTGVNLQGCQITDAEVSWLRPMSSLDRLNLANTSITDAALRNLRSMPKLSSLVLEGTRTTGSGLSHLSELKSLVWLDLSGTAVGDDALRHLSGLTSLRALSLVQTRVSGTGLIHLMQLPSLDYLFMNGAPVTEAGIEQIARLPQVSFLTLGECRIGRKELTDLGEMSRLRRLELVGATIADEDTSQVTGFKSLRELTLRGSSVADSGLEFLSGLSSLLLLDLADASMTDAAMVHLSGLSSLVFLDLAQTAVTDEGMFQLAGLSSLQRLYLTNTDLTDEGMQHVKGLSALNGLGLAGTGISDQGLIHLKGLSNLQSLDLSETEVSDAGLKHLYGLGNLQWLYLRGTSVTDAGARALQQATPQHINIEWTRDRERAERR